jgi:very-short-patch-repair endonuclease
MDEKSKVDAVNLFTFLKEYARLSHKPVRSLNSDRYREVFWLGNVPREPECSCVLWKGEVGEDEKPLSVPSDGWLEIRRPERSEPPETSEEVAQWVNVDLWADSKQELPELFSTILNPEWASGMDDEEEEKTPQFLEISDFPEIQTAWDKYIEDEWWTWAEEDRKKEKVQECYNQLFRLHRAKLQMGDRYELILSVGCLNWVDPQANHEQVKRHVLTLTSTVTFDSVNAVVTVRADGSMSDVSLETDMLLLHQQPDEVTDQLLRDRKLELGTDILADKAKKLLKAMAHGLPSGDGRFIDTLDEVSVRATNEPAIFYSPALILRKRSSRTLIDVCEKIKNDLSDETNKLPQAVRTMVGELGVENGSNGHKGQSEKREWAYEEQGEIFFPLTSNYEQKQIIGRIEKQTGVLVQGPPGTGKSQTICNLICHLLANGKRILITSQKTPALRVLRDMLPPSVVDLCVLLLGEGHDQQVALQKSVSEITFHYTSFSESSASRKIQGHQKKLKEMRAQESKTFETLCVLRSKEEEDFPTRIGAYKGKLRDIAKQLYSEKDSFAWFRDDLPSGIILLAGEVPACPVPAAEALATLSFLRSVSPADEEQGQLRVPSDDDLPSPEKVEAMAERESKELKALESRAAHFKHPARTVLTVRSVEDLKPIAEQLHKISSLKSATLGRDSGWEVAAGQEIMAGESVVWVELQRATEALLKQIRERLSKAAKFDVNGMGDRPPRAVLKDARELLKHLCDGGTLGAWFSRPLVVKRAIYLLKDVSVDGRLCKTCESLEDLIQWLELQEAIQGLKEQWQAHATSIDIAKAPLNQVVGRFEQEYQRLIAVMSLGGETDAISEILMTWDPAIIPAWEQPESVTALERLAKAIIAEKILFQVRDWFSAKIKKISVAAISQPTAPQVKQALTSLESRSVSEYREAYNEIRRLNKVKATIKERDQRVSSLKDRLPRLASTLLDSIGDSSWDKLLKNIEHAWNWKCAEAWLIEVSDPGAERKLQTNLKQIRAEISDTLANLAAELAWRHCINKMGDANYSSLIAWKNAIDRLGKGTGKYAERNRSIARDRLEECRGAVPAWVMPIHRILDTVKPAPGIFDVVIIDEASQSGPEALFLAYLAKQIVVVGDDKQIRPETIGLDQDQVHQLQRRYLKEIPHREIYDPTESLFGIATVRFGNPVRLREHFRCMPEIIGFSNRLSYEDQPLIPLRQFGGDRIEPVLKAIYVQGGFQDLGKGKVNKVEAEQLVDAIEQCCEDPRYRDKSIGVISLLNTSDQDRYIEQLLVNRLDPEEIERRNIICGDAYDFQGDERDIIFLSTVSARSEGTRVRAMTGQKAERRFNVAASRAKDQMWLFHSFNAGELGQKCLRRRLLTYMNEPRTDPLGGTISMSLAELHEMAKTAQRSVDSPPHPFDSWFEVDVYQAIADRQYVVVPQYEVRGYRIDMVIIGGARKLAVECDGDYWHGPEEYEKDLRRQYDLERCDWEFFRVRGSTFYHNPEMALDDLWKLLAHSDFGGSSSADEEAGDTFDYDTTKSADEAAFADEAESESGTIESPGPIRKHPRQEKAAEVMSKRTTKKKTKIRKMDVSSAEDLLTLTNKVLGEAIISILGERPNNSCKKETMTTLVCQYYNVLTRGNPRIKIQRKVNGVLTHLKKKKFAREYKAKNIRIQLMPAGKSLLAKSAQMGIPFNIIETQVRERRDASVGGSDGLLLRAIELLKKEQRQWSRSEIIKALKMRSSDWKELVRGIVSHDEIVRTGEKLTTRYRYQGKTDGKMAGVNGRRRGVRRGVIA